MKYVNELKKNNSVIRRIIGASPVLFLLAMIAIITVLSGTIKAEKTRLAEENMTAISTEKPASNVVVLNVKPTVVQDSINLPGVIEPWNSLNLLSKIHGTIMKLDVAEGERVEKGQIISLIDPADYQIALDSAKATYELAVANQKRLSDLFARGIIPRAEIESLDAQVKTSKAALDNAELMLSRCEIRAPISGIIQKLDAKEGLLLNVSDPVAEILQIDKVKAVVGIPESDVALVRDIQEVSLSIQALEDKEIVGRTHFLASSPENGARLYRLELEIDNSNNEILPGMFFRAHLIKKTFNDAVAVPLYTVIKRQNQQYVFVEENGLAKQLPVELGIIEDWRVQITSGLSAGSKVVVEGHRDIDQGHKLNVVRVINDLKEVAL